MQSITWYKNFSLILLMFPWFLLLSVLSYHFLWLYAQKLIVMGQSFDAGWKYSIEKPQLHLCFGSLLSYRLTFYPISAPTCACKKRWVSNHRHVRDVKKNSTSEAPHDFVRQLLNNDNLSIKRLILTSQMTIHNQSIDGKVLLQENDSVNLRLFEAFYIRKWKP